MRWSHDWHERDILRGAIDGEKEVARHDWVATDILEGERRMLVACGFWVVMLSPIDWTRYAA